MLFSFNKKHPFFLLDLLFEQGVIKNKFYVKIYEIERNFKCLYNIGRLEFLYTFLGFRGNDDE